MTTIKRSGGLPMRYWVYKCNSKNPVYAGDSGDWSYVFGRKGPCEWGSTEFIPALEKLRPGDRLIAHQTDRNELVGLAEVVRFNKRGGFHDLIVQRLETIGVKVRPLKKRDARIGAIPALQGGVIATLYEITNAAAEHYLRVAGSKLVGAAKAPPDPVCQTKPRAKRGGSGLTSTEAKNLFGENWREMRAMLSAMVRTERRKPSMPPIPEHREGAEVSSDRLELRQVAGVWCHLLDARALLRGTRVAMWDRTAWVEGVFDWSGDPLDKPFLRDFLADGPMRALNAVSPMTSESRVRRLGGPDGAGATAASQVASVRGKSRPKP